MTEMTGLMMARNIAEAAKGRQHRLAAYQVDGEHAVSPGQYDGIMRYLSRCPVIGVTREEDMGRTRTAADARALQETPSARPVISDIPQGFYATPSRTGNNDLDFWKVRVNKKSGYRSVARVIGGGDTKYPRLVEISNPEQRAALGAILRAGVGKSADDYADNEERCKKCGSQLTDDVSRAENLGPDCGGRR